MTDSAHPQSNTGLPADAAGVGGNTVNQQQENSHDILDILFEKKIISQVQYQSTKTKSATTGTSPEKIIEQHHLATEEQLAQAKAQLLGIPFISLSTTAFAPEAINFVPQAVVERFNVIPFAYDDKTGTLSVAMANPVDLEAIQFIRQKTSLNIKAFAASPSEVKHAIDS